MPLLDQRVGQVGADEAGSAGDEVSSQRSSGGLFEDSAGSRRGSGKSPGLPGLSR
jgi:hypothetical protein